MNDDAPEPCVVLAERRATAATGMGVTSVMASASNSSVKPEPGRAHGTVICLRRNQGR